MVYQFIIRTYNNNVFIIKFDELISRNQRNHFQLQIVDHQTYRKSGSYRKQH
jgi:hypothetical protein